MEEKINVNVLAILGASGSGKSYLRNMLIENDFKKPYNMQNVTFHSPLQVTTRKPRLNEKDSNYIFINEEQYNYLFNNNELTAVTSTQTKYDNEVKKIKYGTLKNTIVFNKYVINTIVCNDMGLMDLNEYLAEFAYCNLDKYEINLKSALVLSEIDEDKIDNHGRNIDFVQNELMELLNIPYDIYIPNYSECLNFEKATDKILKEFS